MSVIMKIITHYAMCIIKFVQTTLIVVRDNVMVMYY